MLCDACDEQVDGSLFDQIQQREVLGTVICSDCRNSVGESPVRIYTEA